MSLDFTSLTILNTGLEEEKNSCEEKSSPLRHFLCLLKNQVDFAMCQFGKMLGIVSLWLRIIGRQDVMTVGNQVDRQFVVSWGWRGESVLDWRLILVFWDIPQFCLDWSSIPLHWNWGLQQCIVTNLHLPSQVVRMKGQMVWVLMLVFGLLLSLHILHLLYTMFLPWRDLSILFDEDDLGIWVDLLLEQKCGSYWPNMCH